MPPTGARGSPALRHGIGRSRPRRTPPAGPSVADGAHRLTQRERVAARSSQGAPDGRAPGTPGRRRRRERLLRDHRGDPRPPRLVQHHRVPVPAGAVGGTSGGGAPRLAVAGLENGSDGTRRLGRGRRHDPIGGRRPARRRAADCRRHDDVRAVPPTGRSSSRSRSTPRSRDGRTCSRPTGSGPATRSPGSPPLRGLDDDPVVGEPSQVEGPPQGRPEVLIIPPVDRTVIVKARGTRSSQIAARRRLEADIISFNGLASDKVIGQTLILPGGHGQADPDPEGRGRSRPLRWRWRRGAGRRTTAAGSSPGRSPAAELDQPVLPLRPPGPRHPGAVRLADRGRRVGHGDLRRLEGQRRRLPGLDRPRLRALHDLQPHVGDHRRRRPVSRSSPAGRAGRPVRLGDRAALPLRGLARSRLENGSYRVNPLIYL